MAERIEHTPFEWTQWRGRVVLFKRISFKPLWGLCIFGAGYLAVMSTLIVVLFLILGPPDKPFPPPVFLVFTAVISIAFLYSFIKFYRTEEGVILPIRVWRVGCGVKLAFETLRIPQPTTMGGTLPGAPTRWLVVSQRSGKTRRVVQVYHDVDLMRVNLALAGLNPK